MVTREQKITLGEMRQMGVRGLLVYCSDYKCAHSVAINADRWPDHVRLSDLEVQFVCQACGTRGDLRPDFNWDKKQSNEKTRPERGAHARRGFSWKYALLKMWRAPPE